MTGLIIRPDLDKAVVSRRGIFTIPAEDATVKCDCPQPCQGLRVSSIPLEKRSFELLAKQMGDTFIARMKVRGFEWVGGDLRMHGPFPSYDFNHRLADVESSVWREAMQRSKDDGFEHPERALAFVFDRDGAFNPYADYLLVGSFLFQDKMTDLEVP